MKIMPISDEVFPSDAKTPLDYRAFVDPIAHTDPVSHRIFLTRLHASTGGGRLARLFANNQWCFGDKIVELAELEDIEPHKACKTGTKVSL